MEHGDADHHHRDHHHAQPRGAHREGHCGRLRDRIRSIFIPHSRDTSESVASALASSSEGVRAFKVSLVALAITAGFQLVVVLGTGSVGLLSDTIRA